MKFKINEITKNPEFLKLCGSLYKYISKKGHEQVSLVEDSNFVLNLIDLESPKAYRRKSQEEMVVSIAIATDTVKDMKSSCYIALVKSISNILFCINLDTNKELKVFSITPEVGFTEFNFDIELIYKYMFPVISSHFVLRNRFTDETIIKENEIIPEVDDIIFYGKELLKLGVLPAPFPLMKFLKKELIDQLYRLYQIKGLSYGNLSIRNRSHKAEVNSFWMTARGVDKSDLKGFGKDILLVKGFDHHKNEMIVSVPSINDPKIRVSVDAVEHYHIYNQFPDVGAIVHVHGWIDGMVCTTQSHPCGTRELAENVVSLLKSTSSPERTEVGLKNHGLTITGPDIRDIFKRLDGRLKTSVPMLS